ncbi:YncE family protein [Cytobacillus sp. IB215665]|uniref:YncE family protein n=1 Tax=Cytobacillus sp. IB215665 TaxID=3097357 RepID=UPI002A185EAF|nr:YncE family protein [Cytobacillus sp. IB215665]MDX8366317.1 YncE family protein [Cytobacillus sp. IB215665]
MATFVIDAKSHSVIATIPEGNFPPATFKATPFSLTPNEKIAYFINSNGMNDPVISVIDVKTHSLIAPVPVGDNPIAVAVAPNGKTAYVANAFGNSITVLISKPIAWLQRFPPSHLYHLILLFLLTENLLILLEASGRQMAPLLLLM